MINEGKKDWQRQKGRIGMPRKKKDWGRQKGMIDIDRKEGLEEAGRNC